MHVAKVDAQSRKVDSAMTILNYFSPTASSKVSLVAAELNGEHSLRRNNDCDQIYYVLGGKGIIDVDNDESPLQKGDAVLILAGQTHRIVGNLELLIVNGPAFDPNQTEVLG